MSILSDHLRAFFVCVFVSAMLLFAQLKGKEQYPPIDYADMDTFLTNCLCVAHYAPVQEQQKSYMNESACRDSRSTTPSVSSHDVVLLLLLLLLLLLTRSLASYPTEDNQTRMSLPSPATTPWSREKIIAVQLQGELKSTHTQNTHIMPCNSPPSRTFGCTSSFLHC